MDNPAWNIRIATHSDFSKLLDFARENFILTYADQNDPEDFEMYLKHAFDPNLFKIEFEMPGTTFYLCEIDNDLMGYYKMNVGEAQTEPDHPKSAEIERIYVSQELKGRGLGKAMIRHACQIASDYKLKYIWLGVWEQNPEAISFYQRMGFEEIDTHIFQMGNDAQTDKIMRLMI